MSPVRCGIVASPPRALRLPDRVPKLEQLARIQPGGSARRSSGAGGAVSGHATE